MDSKLFPFLSKTSQGNEDEQRIAETLNSILLVILIGCITAILLVPFFTPERVIRLSYILIIFAIVLVTKWLIARGRNRIASVFLLSAVWIVIVATSLTSGGLRSPTFTGGNMVIIAAAGLLLGWQGAALFSVLGTLMGLSLMINDHTAIWKLPTDNVTSASLWIGNTVFYLMTALLFSIAIQRIKEAFARVQEKEKALRESEERFRTFMDTSPAIVIIKDIESRYVYCNAPFEKLFNMSAAEVVGKSEFDLFPYEDAVKFTASDQKVLASGQAEVMEHSASMPGGIHRDWWVFKFPLTSPSGQKYVGMQVLDITDRKQMEREREVLIRDLETRNAELERFTYTVSHDLKSPLVTIRGFLGFLEQNIKTGNQEKIKSDMQRIVEATNKMQKLLAELLELSRIGRIINPPVAVPFEELAQEAVGLVAGQIEQNKVKVEITTGMPVVHVDRARLVEVLQNLLDNATKFMANQPCPWIKIGICCTENNSPVFFVRDNGIGIPPQYHERIFALFEKLDPLMEGTGIGLAVVKRIIEVHGGKIWVESEGIGKGSTFCFTLS